MPYYIYKTICEVNNKIYIGQHKTDNVADGYLGSGKLVRRAIEKYGKENFTREVLEEVFTFDEARKREEYFIEYFKSTDRNIGYNITKYAWGGQPITDAARKKISDKLTGITRSAETRQRMSKPKGERTDEHKKKISEANLGKSWYYNPKTNLSKCLHPDNVPDTWVKGRPKSHFKNTHSNEANDKRSKKLLGQQKSESTKEKLRSKSTGHKVSAETRAKISQSLKARNKK